MNSQRIRILKFIQHHGSIPFEAVVNTLRVSATAVMDAVDTPTAAVLQIEMKVHCGKLWVVSPKRSVARSSYARVGARHGRASPGKGTKSKSKP